MINLQTPDYKLENNTDLDLDQLIGLLESSHDIKIEGLLLN